MNQFAAIIAMSIALVQFACLASCQQMKTHELLDIQGHRGCRGLMPENTLDAFQKALELGVTTLELDLAISKDHQVIVSHEPYFRSAISLQPDGQEIPKESETEFNMYRMDYDSIRMYDVGSKPDPRFPERENRKAYRPLLKEVIELAKVYATKNTSPIPYFNIEIKRSPMFDTIFHPDAESFADLVLEVVNQSGVKEKFIIQSFDLESLKLVHSKDPSIPLALLIEHELDYRQNIEKLGFIPAIYSCYFKLVTQELIDYCKANEMKLIPWTVNEYVDIQSMLDLQVDGIISDYPNRIVELLAK